jgi:hypothetical protein
VWISACDAGVFVCVYGGGGGVVLMVCQLFNTRRRVT